MFRTFTLTGNSNILTSTYFPPIELNPQYSYGLGLVGFYSYNSIPNVQEGNNKFKYYEESFTETELELMNLVGSKPTDKEFLLRWKTISIPKGAYEITEINRYLQSKLDSNNILLQANSNTLKCEIQSKYTLDFRDSDSIGRLLGFSEKVLPANVLYSSEKPVEIVKVINIRVECNITSGAYYNNNLSHTIFEFDVNVEPGYRLTKEPANIIYLPVLTNSIDNITLTIVDQDGDLVNFANEDITIRLELKQLTD